MVFTARPPAGAVGAGLLILQEDDTKREAIRRALAAGCNWIDTAASYGQGQSETAVGWLMKELEPEKRPYVSTKVGVASHRGGAPSIREQIETAFADSSARLQMDSFDLYQLHSQIVTTPPADGSGNALTPEEILGPGGVADVFDQMKRDGRIKHCGLTATGDTEAVLAVLNSGRFDTAQCYYNMLNPSCGWAQGAAPAGWSDEDQDFGGIFVSPLPTALLPADP